MQCKRDTMEMVESLLPGNHKITPKYFRERTLAILDHKNNGIMTLHVEIQLVLTIIPVVIYIQLLSHCGKCYVTLGSN